MNITNWSIDAARSRYALLLARSSKYFRELGPPACRGRNERDLAVILRSVAPKNMRHDQVIE